MNAPLRLGAAGVACALAITAQPAHAVAPAPTTQGHLVTRHDKTLVDVPLARTDVHLRVDGMLVDATVTQHFRNPYADKIEAVYLFPLPTGAAVDDLLITSGGRTIHGQLAERAAATRTYEAARARGEVAALLTEERPNLFTQTIANLEPGAAIDVTLHYVQRLAYSGDGYELVFPMVAPPRYTPAAAAGDPVAISPTDLPPGQRSSADIQLDVRLDAAVPITQLASPSHQVVVARPTPQTAELHLAPGDTIPNKDFILRYQVAGPAPALGVLAHRDGLGDGSFLLVAQPPAAAADPPVTPREVIFLVDTSSSMRGAPLAKAQDLVRRVLAGLRPDDTFQIVHFDDTAAALAAAPIANKPHNLELALRWLGHLQASGTTEVAAGLDAAFAQPHDRQRLRVVVFVGDGFVGDEDAILARATAELGDARLFCFGVGSAVNRYLLEELARLGRGALQVVRPDEDTAAATAAFARRIDAPVLTGVTIDWGGLAVRDVTPAAVPDVFLGEPLVLAGHYARAGHATITVHATAGGRAVSLPLEVTLPEHDAAHAAIATVWARERIAELSRLLVRKDDPTTVRAIIALSLASHVLTRFTAFVAVDDARVTSGPAARRVAVPVEIPEGVQDLARTALAATGSSGGFGAVGYGTSVIGGVGYGYGAGHGTLAPRITTTASAPAVLIGTPQVVGDLDLSIIRRYLKRSFEKIRYCYEKQLLARPTLHGEVDLVFAIGEDGLVASSTATGFDPEVSSCVADVVRTIEFPAHPGGGVSQIHYPIVFQIGEAK